MGLLTAVLAGGASAAAASPPSYGGVGEILLTDLLSPVVARLREAGLGGLALRQGGGREEMAEALVDWLVRHDPGLEIYELDDDASAPEGVALLDYEVVELSLDLPETQPEFLGLGPERVRRTALLRLQMRLFDPDHGRWLSRGTPEVRYEDWVTMGELPELEADLPAWMPRPGRPGVGGEASTPWYERLTVLSLLAGAALLYFSGAK